MTSLIYWPQVAGPIASSSSIVHDPYFSSVVQLAHFDAGNGNTGPYTNSSSRGNQFAVSGGGALSNTQVKWGASSAKVATTSQFYSCATNADYAFGSGDFTIEFWLWMDDITGTKEMFDMRPTTTNGAYVDLYVLNSDLRLWVSSADRITATAALTATTWTFIALSRVSGSTRLYAGTSGTANQVGSTYTDSTTYLQSTIRMGTSAFATDPASVCYYDDVRLTKGIGRYSGTTCPVPTAAFPNF